uniref:Monocarboxylate transporter 12 n=1 Tax=Schistocephalus solidus TaxID=70667 RepID=A0A0X3PLW1_SCHSO
MSSPLVATANGTVEPFINTVSPSNLHDNPLTSATLNGSETSGNEHKTSVSRKTAVSHSGISDLRVLRKVHPENTAIDRKEEEPEEAESDGDDKVFGPMSKEEAEQLQLEANEETTRSEDLRLFLQEMHQHISQSRQQQTSWLPSQQQPSQVAGSQVSFGSQFDAKIQSVCPQQQLPVRSGPSANTNMSAGGKRSVTGEQIDYVLDSAPDGGWGWLVVFGSFCCMILVDGISLCYGLLLAPTCPGSYLRALEVSSPGPNGPLLSTDNPFGIVWPPRVNEVPVRPGSCVGISEMGEALGTQSRALLLTPGGLLIGLYLFLGPLASALSNQFDFRPVAMAGGIIATVSLASAAFSRNVETLIGALGVVGGIGFGLIYLPAIATVGHWFKRRRPFAVGLALCGSGFGTVIGGQVLPLLVEWFTWTGALLLLAAACMQCLTVIVLFRPLDTHLRIKQVQHLKKQEHEARRRAAAASEHRLREERDRRRSAKLEQEAAAKAHAAAARAYASQARAAKRALKAQKAQQRRVIYRGSIMQRIIEEKRRQRTVSLGSLDGMVITRDNELIAAPLVADRPPLLTAASITRISEAVMRRMEAKLASVEEGVVCGSVRCDSDVSAPPLEYLGAGVNGPIGQQQLANQPPASRLSSLSRRSSAKLSTASHLGGSKVALSRMSIVRESLPQLVQDYVQSRITLAVQNCMAKQRQDPQLADSTPAAPNPVRSISNATVAGTVGSGTPQTQKGRVFSSLLLNRDLTVCATPLEEGGAAATCPPGDPSTDLPPPPALPQQGFAPSACASESASLHRTISEASLVSSTRGVSGPGVHAQLPPELQQEMADLLDHEVMVEVQQQVRRELMRPQYKKDLFFAGSAHQLHHSPVSGLTLGEVGNVWARRNVSSWDLGAQPSQPPPMTAAPATFLPSTPRAVHPSNEDGYLDAGAATELAEQPSHGLFNRYAVAATDPISTNASSSVAAVNQSQQPSAARIALDYDGGDVEDATTSMVGEDDDIDLEGLSTSAGPRFLGSNCYAVCCPSPICSFLEELLAPGLLLSPTFLCLLLSNLLTIVGIVIPYFLLPDLAAEMNWTPRTAGSIISYVGLANTIGRCIATLYIEKAWSSNYKWADCLRVNVASLLLCGISVGIIPLGRDSYNCVVIAGCAFGLFSAVVVSLKSILVVELFGLDRLTNAFGHMLLLQGLSSIAAAPLGGYLWDKASANAAEFNPWSSNTAPDIRAADYAFYLAAAGLIGAGLLGCPLRCLSRRETITATFSNAAGGVYVEDYLDGQMPNECQLSAAADVVDEGVSVVGVSTQLAATAQQQHAQATGQLPTQLPLDSGISSYDPTSGPAAVGAATVAAAVAGGASQTPSGGTVLAGGAIGGDGPPDVPAVSSGSVAVPPILSPAPLPSSLFLPVETQPVLEPLATAGPAGTCEEPLLTTAGVPLALPPLRTVEPSGGMTTATAPTTAAAPQSWPTGMLSSVAPEVMAIPDEPALEPVVEEEEEDIESEEGCQPHHTRRAAHIAPTNATAAKSE